jgi:hypothetical protein
LLLDNWLLTDEFVVLELIELELAGTVVALELLNVSLLSEDMAALLEDDVPDDEPPQPLSVTVAEASKNQITA